MDDAIQAAVPGEGYGVFLSADNPPADWVQNLIAANPIASVVSDPRLPDNPIVAVNQPFLSLTGYGPEHILDRNCRFLSGEGTEPWLSDKIRESVADERSVLVEILNYKADGSPFRNAVLIAPIFNDDGDLLYFLGSQVEIEDNGPSMGSTRREQAVATLKTLSPRQMEVTQLVAQGLRNKQIAGELGLSEKTVKMHRGLVMEKLGLDSSAQLVRLAVEAGI